MSDARFYERVASEAEGRISDRTRTAGVAALGAAIVLILPAAQAHAYSTASSLREGCHERMVISAIEVAGWPARQQPPPLTEYDRRIADDLQFDVARSARNAWGVAMLLGVRHADLQGNEPTDFVELSNAAAEPDAQDMHCLRGPADDGAEGNATALEACRDFIREQITLATGGADVIDMSATEKHEVVLDFRGEIELELNRFGFRMGLALHALQDGFSHAFRTPDARRVTHVLNYVDWVANDYAEARDGHNHESYMDQCEDMGPAQAIKTAAAHQASAELLAAVVSATTHADRMARVDAVLAGDGSSEGWLRYDGGCTIANDYCSDPILAELDQTGGCAVAYAPGVGGRDSAVPWLAALAIALGVARRRRRRTTGGRGREAALLASLLALATLGTSAAASAQDTFEEAAEVEREQPNIEVVGVDHEDDQLTIVERRRVDAEDLGAPVDRGFGVYLGGGASIDEGGFFAQGELRLDVLDNLMIGAGAEYNPWWSEESGNVAAGTANVYASAVLMWAVVDTVEIRSTLRAGASILLFDMVGADSGSIGPFGGVTPLGIAIRLGPSMRLSIDPGGVYASVPQPSGVPLVRVQHRLTTGLHWSF